MEGLTCHFIVSGSNVLIEMATKMVFYRLKVLNYQSFFIHWYIIHTIIEGQGWYPACARLSSAKPALGLLQRPYFRPS